MNVDLGDGGVLEVEVDGLFEKVRKIVKVFVVKENGIELFVIVGEVYVFGFDNDWVKFDVWVLEDKDFWNEVLVGLGVIEIRGRDCRVLVGCDIVYGKWVYDEIYLLYRFRNCFFVDFGFWCEENGWFDIDYMKYWW